MDLYPGTLIVCSALKLAPLLFVRPGELRSAEWSQFDLERAEMGLFYLEDQDVAHSTPVEAGSLYLARTASFDSQGEECVPWGS